MDLELVHSGVRVTVEDGPYVADGAPTAEALKFVASLIGRLNEIRRYAAKKKLLRLYNESWRDENHDLIDEDSFVEKLTDPQVVINDEIGSATVYFDDGDLFAGHYIEVIIFNDELFDAGIIG
jgi:hypothetical protein